MRIDKLKEIILNQQELEGMVEYFLLHRELSDKRKFLASLKALATLLKNDKPISSYFDAISKKLSKKSIWMDYDAIYEIFLHIESFLYGVKMIDAYNYRQLYPYLKRELKMSLLATDL